MRTGLTVLTTPAPSLEAAHEIAGRLTHAGFARNSIDVHRGGENEFEVSIHLKEVNIARAERAISNTRGELGMSNVALLLSAAGAVALGAGLLAMRTVKNA